ncbi:MAG: hypothetical protein JOZ96_16185 [Acidobacteria bacterium]|nr:hypothetical protein [Acidobacteriota bacterium]
MTRSDLTDRIMAVSAVVVALASLVVAVYEARTNREYQKVSVWPYVTQSNAWVPGEPYTRSVSNLGVGPALVKSFQVSVDGKPRRDWAEVSRALTGQPIPELVYSSVHAGSVLLPERPVPLVRIPPGDAAQRFWEQAQTPRLSLRLCYCSLYEDCWLADTQTPDPTPTSACHPDPDTEFAQ